MNEIAEAAGVTKPVLYQHFRSKQDLYAELLTDVGAQLQAAITEAVSSADGPRRMVEQGFDAYFDFVDEHRAAFRLLFSSDFRTQTRFAEIVSGVENAIAEQIAALIEIDGLSKTSRRLLGHGIVGMVEAACEHWLSESTEATPAELSRHLADLAWRGLRGVHP